MFYFKQFLFIYLFIYLFILGCTGCSLLCEAFSPVAVSGVYSLTVVHRWYCVVVLTVSEHGI